MGKEVRQRAERCRHQHEGNVAPRPEAARERRTEWQQPSEIKAQMHEIGMDEGVSKESPQIGAKAAWERAADGKIGAIARRNECEGEEKLQVLLVRQYKGS